jgi:DNA polymerase-3 subunit gamma/tau
VSLALYRRYRPETFAEVIGQEHVTEPLQQALRNNRVNHAYLFSGPRGCGKTTSARILARCLNCAQGPTPTPCGECQSCRDLAKNGPGSIDVIEIDAASHGGVDDARDLREKAFFGPASSRYKIYIIDEAHMVTSAGFNALLKVVEEPPEHLKFIFATTEPEKVIGTIRSRTHHYPFRLVPPGTLRDHLTAVCRQEDITVEDGVFPLVVRAGAGSVRDAMSVMDQLLAGAGSEGVTYAMATALLGYTDSALLDDVVDAFAAGDGAAVFQIVDRVIEGGHDPRRFVADLLERLRDLVILAAVPDAADKGLIDAPRDVLERMQAQAGVFGAAELSRAADIVNTGLTEMRGATSPRLQLELICARVLLPAAYDDERSVQARLERLERGTPGGPVAGPPVAGGPGAGGPAAGGPGAPVPGPVAGPPAAGPPAARDVPPSPVPPPPPVPPAEAPAPAPGARQPGAWPTGAGGQGQQAAPAARQPAPQGGGTGGGTGSGGGDASRVRQMWPQILDAVKNRRRLTWMLLFNNAQVSGFDGETLQVGFDNPGARNSFVNNGSEDVLRQAINDALGQQWRIEAIVDPSGGGASGGGGGGGYGGGGGGAPRTPAPPQAPSAPQGYAPAGPGPGDSSGGAPGAGAGGGDAYASARTAARAPGGVPSAQGGAPGGTAAPAAPAPPAQRTGGDAPQRPAGRLTTDEVPPPLEEDIPEDDDPDLVDSALSGHDLFIRELGATVIEEIQHS